MTAPIRRGRPDWNTNPSELAGTQVDAALASELTALGISRINSLGRPLWFSNFSMGIDDWVGDLLGVGGSAIAYGLNGYSGPHCARLTPGSVSMGIYKLLSTTPSSRMGLEAAFYVPATRGPIYIEMSGQWAGATNLGVLVLDTSGANPWKIDVSGSFQAIALSGINNTPGWIQVKLVCDFRTGKYVYAIVSDQNKAPLFANLAGLSLTGGGLPLTGAQGIEVIAGAAGGALPVDFGYVLLTIDEP